MWNCVAFGGSLPSLCSPSLSSHLLNGRVLIVSGSVVGLKGVDSGRFLAGEGMPGGLSRGLWDGTRSMVIANITACSV